MKNTLSGLERRQSEKRTAILAAAKVLFFEEGYGRTTMDRVLSAVGGSKRTLYGHFENKEALFKAIIAQVSDRVLSALTPQIESNEIRETLIDMGVRYLQVMTSAEGIALYRAMVAEAIHFPDLADNFIQNGPCRASKHLADYLHAQSNQKHLHIANPDLAAAQFMGMVRGNAHLLAVLTAQIPTDDEINTIVETAVDSFLTGCIHEGC